MIRQRGFMAVEAILFICFVLALATAVAQTLRLHSAKTALAEHKAQVQTERARAAEAARQAEANYRALEAAWIRKHQEIAHEAEQNARKVAVAAAAGAIAGDGLRQRAASLAAACPTPADAPAAPSGPPAPSAGQLLAYVLGRLEAAGRELAAVADARGVAGQACERAYEALLP